MCHNRVLTHKSIIATHHRIVSRASIPQLVKYYGLDGEWKRELARSVRKGSKRPCRRTSHACTSCPVNWDCCTLKAERVKLGWGENS